MKARLTEFDKSFGIVLQPETSQEIVTLARFGLARAKKSPHLGVHFGQPADVALYITFAKKRNAPTSL